MQFGEYIKSQRNKQELTQPQAADLIGIEQSYLSKLENNKAVPSAEIFEKLQSAFSFSMADLHREIDADDLKRLEEIVLVKSYLVEERKSHLKSRNRIMILSVIMLMLGSGIFTYGFLLHNNVNLTYIYESKGVIKAGESKFQYAELPEYNRFNNIMQNEQLRKNLMENPLFKRLDYDQNSYSSFRGNFFDVDVEAGSRRYFLIDRRETSMPTPFYQGVSFGVIFIVGGILGLILGRKV